MPVRHYLSIIDAAFFRCRRHAPPLLRYTSMPYAAMLLLFFAACRRRLVAAAADADIYATVIFTPRLIIRCLFTLDAAALLFFVAALRFAAACH